MTEKYQKLKKFQSFKPSKKIKINEEDWKNVKDEAEENENEKEYELTKEADIQFYSEFEKKCINGRFILEKRQILTSKNTAVKN